MSEANKTQVGGTHYQSAYQHWDFCYNVFGPGYFQGVATKYVARWRKKGGLEDLRKARHYLVKLAEVLSDNDEEFMVAANGRTVAEDFARENALDHVETAIVILITTISSAGDVGASITALDDLIGSASGYPGEAA